MVVATPCHTISSTILPLISYRAPKHYGLWRLVWGLYFLANVCLFVCLSISKTPQQLEIIILHHSSFILHPSSFFIHPSSFFIYSSSSFIILHSYFLHFATFKLFSLFMYIWFLFSIEANYNWRPVHVWPLLPLTEMYIPQKILTRKISSHFFNWELHYSPPPCWVCSLWYSPFWNHRAKLGSCFSQFSNM